VRRAAGGGPERQARAGLWEGGERGPASKDPLRHDSGAGPWWSIGVSGYHEATSGGRDGMAGQAADFVAEISHRLPACMTCTSGTEDLRGTSLAAPRAAGVASAALLAARRAAGHAGGITTSAEGPAMVAAAGHTITNWELRRALGAPGARKPTEACAAMTAQIEARRACWNLVAVRSASWARTEGPYIRC
jgi:hypothetical protein